MTEHAKQEPRQDVYEKGRAAWREMIIAHYIAAANATKQTEKVEA
jgi:hypothetical protein